MLCNDVVFCSSDNHLFFDQPIPSEDLYVVVYGLPVNVKLICSCRLFLAEPATKCLAILPGQGFLSWGKQLECIVIIALLASSRPELIPSDDSASHPSPSNWKDVWRGIVDWVEEL
jgi:hypothetical protein